MFFLFLFCFEYFFRVFFFSLSLYCFRKKSTRWSSFLRRFHYHIIKKNQIRKIAYVDGSKSESEQNINHSLTKIRKQIIIFFSKNKFKYVCSLIALIFAVKFWEWVSWRERKLFLCCYCFCFYFVFKSQLQGRFIVCNFNFSYQRVIFFLC